MRRFSANPPPLIQAIPSMKRGGKASRNIWYALGKHGEKGTAFGDMKGWGVVTQDPRGITRTFELFRPDIEGRESRHSVLSLERFEAYKPRLDAWREGAAPGATEPGYDPQLEPLYARLANIKTAEDFRAVADDLLADNLPLLADEFGQRSIWVSVIHHGTPAAHGHLVQSNYDPRTGKCLDIRPEHLRELQKMKWAKGLAPGKRQRDPQKRMDDGTPGDHGMTTPTAKQIGADGSPGVPAIIHPEPPKGGNGKAIPAKERAAKLSASKATLQQKHDGNLRALAALIKGQGVEKLKAAGRLEVISETRRGKAKKTPTLRIDGMKFRFDRLEASGLPELANPTRFLHSEEAEKQTVSVTEIEQKKEKENMKNYARMTDEQLIAEAWRVQRQQQEEEESSGQAATLPIQQQAPAPVAKKPQMTVTAEKVQGPEKMDRYAAGETAASVLDGVGAMFGTGVFAELGGSFKWLGASLRMAMRAHKYMEAYEFQKAVKGFNSTGKSVLNQVSTMAGRDSFYSDAMDKTKHGLGLAACALQAVGEMICPELAVLGENVKHLVLMPGDEDDDHGGMAHGNDKNHGKGEDDERDI